MICPKCGGGGKVYCTMCKGTGLYHEEDLITEQEYIQTCTTEQLAEWLQEHMDCVGCPASQEKCHRYYDACKEVMMEWLKQPHTDKE